MFGGSCSCSKFLQSRDVNVAENFRHLSRNKTWERWKGRPAACSTVLGPPKGLKRNRTKEVRLIESEGQGARRERGIKACGERYRKTWICVLLRLH